MLRIGLVDLDTSHPKAFTTILNQMEGVKVTALYDGHTVYPPGYDKQFALENGIDHVCESLDELVSLVDAAIIHSVDWDQHIEKALPFLVAGIPILIDKPIVGKVRDIARLLDLQGRYKTPIFGGSSLRFAEEINDLKKKKAEFGDVSIATASGPGDIFAYGIHTTEMAQGFLGSGVDSVQFIGENKTALFRLSYRDGPILLLQLHSPHHEWSLSLYTPTGLHVTKVDSTKVYPPFLANFLRVVHGEEVDFSLRGALEAVKIHIAAWKSKLCRRPVRIEELLPEDGFEGASFARDYAAEKKRQMQDQG